MSWLRNLFRRVGARDLLEEQLFEAERQLVLHQAAAEMHAAMAAVYRMRAARIKGTGTVVDITRVKP